MGLLRPQLAARGAAGGLCGEGSAAVAALTWPSRDGIGSLATVQLFTRLLAFSYLLAACNAASGRDNSARTIDRELDRSRVASGRLSHQSQWRHCDPIAPSDERPIASCRDSARTLRSADLVRAIPAYARPDTSVSRNWAIAMVNMLSGRPSALDGATSSLERARDLAPDRAPILNDLAVAYLSVAERDQRLVPALRALDVAEQAATLDSSYVPALFNRALMRERLYLLVTARREWQRFQDVERVPQWREEAVEHLQQLQRDNVLPDARAVFDGGSAAEMAGIAAQLPQEAREAAYRKLGEWGDAVLRGDSATAGVILRSIASTAKGLDSIGGDRSVSLALTAIANATRSPSSLQALARGHSLLARGTKDVLESSYEEAAEILSQAKRDLQRGHSSAVGWASLYEAWSHIGLGAFSNAEQVLRHLIQVTPDDLPALAGKARWALGVVEVRRGNYALAERSYREATPFLTRSSEGENLAGISFVLTETLTLAGRTTAARREALLGLRRLSQFRHSGYLTNHLTTVASIARSEGLTFAARAIRDEVLAVAELEKAPDAMAWALRDRAEDLMLEGNSEGARRDLAEARDWVHKMQPGAGTERVEADIDLIAAQLMREANPRAAQGLLQKAASTYRRLELGVFVPAVLRELALASEQVGDTLDARRRLDEAIGYIERQTTTFESPDRRAAFQETVEGIFDEVVRLELAAGRPDAALAYLERSRVAAWRAGRTGLGRRPVIDAPRIAELPRRLPRHTVLVDYAVLSDRIAIWVASADSGGAGGWENATVRITRDSVARLVRTARAGEPKARDQALGKLFEILVQPIGSRARSARRMAIVPDRELFQLPFAALRDPTSGRYLVEDRELATIPNAVFLVAESPGELTGVQSNPVVVANSEGVETASGRLPALPGALAEGEQIAPLYHNAMFLKGRLSRAPFLQALKSASVFHFAGHAVFDLEQPELSYLVVASPVSGEGFEFPAWEIATMSLSNLKLVVLSACSTLGPRVTRTGALAGLAYSFLAAGAPSTISTIWDINDDSSVGLMVELHRGLVEGLPPSAALRRAQLHTLRSGKDMQSWSAFIYSGPFTG